MNYQELWINGPVDEPHQRGCSSRYESIKSVAERYNRPFSVFDFGGNFGYFSLRLSQEFDAFCAILDNKEAASIIRQNDPSKIVSMKAHIDSKVLLWLAKSEHFDIVLALSVLHHMDDWEAALDALLMMGDTVLVEIPGADEPTAVNSAAHKDIYDKVKSLAVGELSAEVSHLGASRTIFELRGKSVIEMQSIDALQRQAPSVDVKIESDYEKAMISISHGGASPSNEIRPLIPGMNLWNWKLLNGNHPLDVAEMVDEAVKSLPSGHDDMMPWNFLIDGEKVIPIDYDNKDFREGSFDTGKLIEMLK